MIETAVKEYRIYFESPPGPDSIEERWRKSPERDVRLRDVAERRFRDLIGLVRQLTQKDPDMTSNMIWAELDEEGRAAVAAHPDVRRIEENFVPGM